LKGSTTITDMFRTPLLSAIAVGVVAAATVVGLALPGNGDLRVMPIRELIAKSVLIARVKVDKTDESDWGDFKQIAKLDIVDVIEGDFTLKDVRVASNSLVANTDDKYGKKEEWLVFLIRDGGLYRTLNYQFGRFRLDGDVVRGWRDADNVISDKPYYSVREEIEIMLTEIKSPVEPDAPEGDGQPSSGEGPKTALQPGQSPVKPKPGPPKVTRPDRP
jgi:hypothetical protein